MLFITNRFPKQGMITELNRSFDFELNNNSASNSIFFCEYHRRNKHTEIGSIHFLKRLKESRYRQILIYIHGYSNLPNDVFKTTQELQALCNKSKKNEILVIPLIWPCDNDLGLVGDYWDDQKSADQSAFSFARILEKFLAWRTEQEKQPNSTPCLKRINILSHSMGNRVLRETLRAWNKYDLPQGVPMLFRNTFMLAADVVNETLQKGEAGELICHASRNVIVYYASDDLALRASKASNLKNKIASRRLGHTGPENVKKTPKNVYQVDCDDVNNVYDRPIGHSYFKSGKKKGEPGEVFEHIFSCLLSGRVFPNEEERRSSIIHLKKKENSS